MVDYRDIGQILLNTKSPEQRNLGGFQGFVKTLNDAVNKMAEDKAAEQLAKEKAQADKFNQMVKQAEEERKVADTLSKNGALGKTISPKSIISFEDAVRSGRIGYPLVAGEQFAGVPTPLVPSAQPLPLPNLQPNLQGGIERPSLGVEAPQIAEPAIPQAPEVVNSSLALPEVKPTATSGGLTFEQRLQLKMANPNTLTEEKKQEYINTVKANPASYYSLPPTTRNQIYTALHNAGVDVLPKEQFKAANDAEASSAAGINAVNIISKNIGSLIGADTAPEAWIQYAGNKLGSVFKSNADAAVYESTVNGMIPMVARAIGHTGVLTQPDVDSTKALFPQLSDTVEIAQRKMENIVDLINNTKEQKLEIFTSVRNIGGERSGGKPTQTNSTDIKSSSGSVKVGSNLQKLLNKK